MQKSIEILGDFCHFSFFFSHKKLNGTVLKNATGPELFFFFGDNRDQMQQIVEGKPLS